MQCNSIRGLILYSMMPGSLLDIENVLLYAPLWQLALGGLIVVWVVNWIMFRPKLVKSPDFYNFRSEKVRRMKMKSFPPPYPNGWVRLCSTQDIAGGKIHSISALGREFVAFRGDNGKAGVLDAYCPHLGAHLGQGGKIVNGNIECPFHSWQFNTDGKAVEIPYCRKDIPSRAKTKAYHVREHLGMVFIWFHAESECQDPQWELEFHKDCLDDSRFYFVTSRQMEFDHHVIEMHLNSADYFHFSTLHKALPLPILDKFLFGLHNLKARYFENAIPSKPHICFFEEKMEKLFLFGKISVVPSFILNSIAVKVTFEGPTIVHFSVKTILGEMRMIKTILPISPFHQYVEARWWADRSVPRWLCFIMTIVAGRALEQDREVWSNKMYHEKPMLVSGDGPFPAFKRYYNQFYSDNSKSLAENELEW